jgi:hypothetical protein
MDELFLKTISARLYSIKKIIEQTTDCFKEELEIIDEIMADIKERTTEQYPEINHRQNVDS